MKNKFVIKRAPTSPGEILKEEYLIPLKLTQKALADHMHVDIKVINRLINGKTSLSPELALKLALTFQTTPEFWLNAQMAVDLYHLKTVHKDLPAPIELLIA